MKIKRVAGYPFFLSIYTLPVLGWAWHDETHLAIAKAAGYEKWYNAAGADITKIKAGDVEKKNHYVNNSPRTIVTTVMALDQITSYNDPGNINGHLYGAIRNLSRRDTGRSADARDISFL